MKKKKQFCDYCGNPVIRKDADGKVRNVCGTCGTIFYENPLPVASSIVINEERELLLVKRKKDPYKDMWCLPMGFAESDEEVHEAALRELEEETGITGEVIRLIDVDTVDNDFYGSLVIVAYEVHATGGLLSPGDDALDARYFPINAIPELAWTSNTKAVKKYLDLYHDLWKMADAVKDLLDDKTVLPAANSDSRKQQEFLSQVLIQIIGKRMNEISRHWMNEVKALLPDLAPFSGLLLDLNRSVVRTIQFWLGRESDTLGLEEFAEYGLSMFREGVPLPSLLTALALSRKSIWLHVVRERILHAPLDIYTTLEINNRIIFFYDKINYYLVSGYLLGKKAGKNDQN
ncbi:MAG: hypothetical protein CVV44_08350 [Spirochaetae bacterium HGW-Spirochaetae-1]|jgi:ADP-ribose pyrophosphatase YjhB (NUDIX family)|nr:MAG: hypothetical protein CVV44_08350 [Spirochaetae bacterium HGW-Spirochaetae-1]